MAVLGAIYSQSTQIRAEAQRVDPIRVLLAILLFVPFVLGWTWRFVFYVLALLWTGAQYGYRDADVKLKALQAGAHSGG